MLNLNLIKKIYLLFLNLNNDINLIYINEYIENLIYL